MKTVNFYVSSKEIFRVTYNLSELLSSSRFDFNQQSIIERLRGNVQITSIWWIIIYIFHQVAKEHYSFLLSGEKTIQKFEYFNVMYLGEVP